MRVGGGALLSDRDVNRYMLGFIFEPLVAAFCSGTQLTFPINDAVVTIASLFGF